MGIYYRHNNISIRPIDVKDLETLRNHRNDPDTWMTLTDCRCITYTQQLNWYNSLKDLYFIATAHIGQNSLDIGLVRIDEVDHINRSARIGCDVFKNYRNLGFGSQVFALVVDYCFNQLNTRRLWLLVLENNAIAKHIYEKHGFEVEGVQKQAIYRKGKYLDYIMMSKINDTTV